MDLAVNIGNSSIRIAVRKENKIHNRQISVHAAGDIKKTVRAFGFEDLIEHCVISSVSPGLTETLYKDVKQLAKHEIIQAELGPGFHIDYSCYDACHLGIDRALCCEAALLKTQAPFAMVDFGTATTINIVDEGRRFLGGMILPGVAIGLSSLNSGTALLPAVTPKEGTALIGRDTEECISSGAIHGNAILVENAISEMWKQLGVSGETVITGGSAELILPSLKASYIHEPDLIIDGLFLILDRIARSAPHMNRR